MFFGGVIGMTFKTEFNFNKASTPSRHRLYMGFQLHAVW